jgi:hypothetical protein
MPGKRPAEAQRLDVAPLAPRLLDVQAAARYLGGISEWTLRSLIADGHLHPVRLPSVKHRGETGRRLLLDVRELDGAIERWRHDG